VPDVTLRIVSHAGEEPRVDQPYERPPGLAKRRRAMAVARVTKITAASAQGFQQAAEEGLKRAAETLRGITGFEVISLKGHVENGKITEYRATLEVTFILE
jgi:flavin-binding protein dodecin